MIHFSTYDCARSLPNMVDGLKISLRKILFSAFKRKLTSEVKVAQFSGYVSEHSAYHHGEASLNGAIVNMAQTMWVQTILTYLNPMVNLELVFMAVMIVHRKDIYSLC